MSVAHLCAAAATAASTGVAPSPPAPTVPAESVALSAPEPVIRDVFPDQAASTDTIAFAVSQLRFGGAEPEGMLLVFEPPAPSPTGALQDEKWLNVILDGHKVWEIRSEPHGHKDACHRKKRLSDCFTVTAESQVRAPQTKIYQFLYKFIKIQFNSLKFN